MRVAMLGAKAPGEPMAAPLHTKHSKQKIDRSDIGERTLAKNKGTFLMRVEKKVWRSKWDAFCLYNHPLE
jgi:hypothetical protein